MLNLPQDNLPVAQQTIVPSKEKIIEFLKIFEQLRQFEIDHFKMRGWAVFSHDLGEYPDTTEMCRFLKRLAGISDVEYTTNTHNN